MTMSHTVWPIFQHGIAQAVSPPPPPPPPSRASQFSSSSLVRTCRTWQCCAFPAQALAAMRNHFLKSLLSHESSSSSILTLSYLLEETHVTHDPHDAVMCQILLQFEHSHQHMHTGCLRCTSGTSDSVRPAYPIGCKAYCHRQFASRITTTANLQEALWNSQRHHMHKLLHSVALQHVH